MKYRNHFQGPLRFALSVFLSLIGATYSHSQETSSVNLPVTEIRALANRILQEAGKADCKPGNCRILVANFTLPSGATSQLGMQLADEFSKELASEQNSIQIIERSHLQKYLEQERIPATLLKNDDAIRWLGVKLDATAVLTGTTKVERESLRVQAKLQSCDKKRTGPIEGFTFPYPSSKASLSPFDPAAKSASSADGSSDPAVLRAGVGGATAPVCMHCPEPSYTHPAREANFQGTLLLDVVVSPNGEMKSAKIMRGLPFGLNDKAINAIRQWKFRPATLNGQPVTVQVMIELAFHL